MKTVSILFVVFCILISIDTSGQKTYTLIQNKSGKINKNVVNSLPPYLKGLAAFYSAMGGTNCIDQQCELTSELGLGNQGSDAQKLLIQKYLPNDKVAKLVIGQDCYLSPSTSSSYSNFTSLSFIVAGDSVRVNYRLLVYNHGNTKLINGPDLFVYRNQIFNCKKRVLYAWADKAK